jgi:pyruvate/2-oxoglutarate/acetoin dehydrogenase E1 component
VVDLRSLRPLDVDKVLVSVGKTNRLLAVEEGPRTGGWASGLLGVIAERGLHDLDDAWIVATGESPIPYSPTLEDDFLPSADSIVAAVRERLGAGVR